MLCNYGLGPREGSTPLDKLCRHVRHQRVRFLGRFKPKMDLDFNDFDECLKRRMKIKETGIVLEPGLQKVLEIF